MSNQSLLRWFRALFGLVRKEPRARRRRNEPVRLALTELETRRVLNGDGAMTELVVDAGEQGDDGQADLFEIDVESGQLTVSLNGETIEHTNTEDISRIRILGSNDSDQVRLNFGDGLGDSFQVDVEGGGGADQLTVSGQTQFDSLIHAISHPAAGTVTAQAATDNLSVEYRGIESIEQDLDAVQVLIDLAQSNANASFDFGANQVGAPSTLVVNSEDGTALEVSMRNPVELLSFNTASGLGNSANRLEFLGDSGSLGSNILVEGDELDSLSAAGDFQFAADRFEVHTGQIDWDARLTGDDADIVLNADASLELTDAASIVNERGSVTLMAESIHHEGEIIASGGHVVLDSGEQGTTLVDGLIDASTLVDGQRGGEVHVLGMHVGLLEQAFLDVSGMDGGGTALIGGDYQGENQSVRNAERTYVSSHAVVAANALERGDGGRVIFWADQWTRFSGTVSARGGSTSGSGGFVEVSGKQSLDYHGSVDLSAANGEVGLLFLDPQNIVISSAGGNDAEVSGDSQALFDDGTLTQTFTISPTAFQTSTANITLQATNDITVTDAITLTQSGITLALQAGHDLIINNSITGAGSNQFIFEADSVHTTDGAGTSVGADGDGTLTIAAVTIDSAGGDIHLLAEAFIINTSASIAAGAGDVFTAESDGGGFGSHWSSSEFATISSTGTLTIGQANTAGTNNTGASAQTVTVSSISVGTRSFASTVASHVRFVSTGNITFTGDVTTNQTLEINADSDSNGVGTFTSGTNDDVNSNGSDISLTAAALGISGDLNAGTGDIVISTSAGTGIGLGASSMSGGMEISGSELNLITAANVTFETDGVIEVDNITDGNSDQISGTVTLQATGAGSTVSFINNASSFNAITIEATDGVSVGQNLTTDVGGITINADTDGNDGVGTLTVSSGRTINSGDEAITLISDAIDLSGNINAGSADVTIQDSDGNGIDLGASTGGLDLSNSEFQRITAANLNLETTGNISVVGASQPMTISGTVSMLANGATSQVTFETTASTFRTLAVEANEGITIDFDLTTTVGGMTFNANLDASADDSGTFSVGSGVAVDSTDQAISITANDVDIVGTVDAGTAAISITEADGAGILLGTGATSAALHLSGTELGQLTATGLTFDTTGSVQLEDVSAAESNNVAGVVSIQTTQSVSLSSGRNATFNALSIAANQGITVNGNLTTDTGDLTLDGDANATSEATDQIAFASGVQVESAGLLSLQATTGDLSAVDTLTLYANDGISIADSLSFSGTGGAVTIDSDRDAGDGVGTLTIASGATVNTNSMTVAVTANDIDLQGSLNSGSASATLQATNGMGLGDTAVAGGMHLSKTELQQISAADLTINGG